MSTEQQARYDSIMEKLINLCEVRGELDDESNARIEAQISSLTAESRRLSNH
jgi:hypothetical protein